VFKFIVNSIDTVLFESEEIVTINDSNIGDQKRNEQILAYMRDQDSYNDYLLLDRDCFPVETKY